MERAKKALVSKQRHLMTMEHRRGGTYFLNQKKKKKKKKKNKTKGKKKRERKKIIELIIKENHCCDLGTERKMRRTLPLGNFQKNKKRPM
jgi:hypothetical protein